MNALKSISQILGVELKEGLGGEGYGRKPG